MADDRLARHGKRSARNAPCRATRLKHPSEHAGLERRPSAAAVAVIVMRVIVVMIAVLVLVVLVFAVIVPTAAGIAMGVSVRVVMVMDMEHVARGAMVVLAMGMLMVMLAMRMLAVLVLVMRVLAVIMPAAAGIAVGVVLMSVVPVGVAMGLGGLLRAGLRLEGRLGEHHLGAKLARHLLDGGVPGDADAVGQQLGRNVTRAELPRDPREKKRLAHHELGHRLGGGGHGDHATIVERQPIAILQPRRLRQVEQEHHVALPAHRDALAMPPVMGQHHTVDGGVGTPGAGGKQRARMDHDRLLGNMSHI